MSEVQLMEISVGLGNEYYTFGCESTDTIAHLKAAVHAAVGIPPHKQRLLHDHAQMGANFHESMTLGDVGLPQKCLLHLESLASDGGEVNETERVVPPPPRLEKNYLYYADAFKSGWRDEHVKVLLNLLLKPCKKGTAMSIFEGKVTDSAWLKIQHGLQNSTMGKAKGKGSFEIDFLKQRSSDYKQLYSLINADDTPIFHWDRQKKRIHIVNSNWWEYHPELLLLCGAYISYFDSLEKVCLLLGEATNSDNDEQKLVNSSRPNSSTF